jgi:hypothetical protein
MTMRNVAFVIIMKLYNISFFKCNLAMFIWRVIHLTFGLVPPNSMRNLFGVWAHNLKITTICWAILCAGWLSQNDIVFNKNTYLVLYVGYL